MASSKKGKKEKGCGKTKARLAKAQEMVRGETPPQTPSKLLQLPRELRDQILTSLFASTSTRVNFRERSTSQTKGKVIQSAPTSLAILRVCRQLHQEAKPLWIGNLLFNFDSPVSLLEKLSALPLSILSQIRHVRLPLRLPGYDDNFYYTLGAFLQTLPGLRLDTFTVLGYQGGIVAYDTLDGLVKRGNG